MDMLTPSEHQKVGLARRPHNDRSCKCEKCDVWFEQVQHEGYLAASELRREALKRNVAGIFSRQIRDIDGGTWAWKCVCICACKRTLLIPFPMSPPTDSKADVALHEARLSVARRTEEKHPPCPCLNGV